MKYINYALIPMAIVSFNVMASNLPAKQVNIPFSNEAIMSTTHSGLAFNYDMNGNPAKKIVCKLSNIYKSWFEFLDQGVFKESGTFGEYQTVTFTSKGNDSDQNESHSLYHADAAGNIKINEVARDKPTTATATCFYEVDNSIK